MPFVEDVQVAARQHVLLSVLEGNDAPFIERLPPPGSVGNLVQIGDRLPVHASSSALVMVAFTPPTRQEAVLALPMQRYTHRTFVNPRRLRQALADVRRDGYLIAEGHVTLSTTSVAVPIRGSRGEVVRHGRRGASRGAQPRHLIPMLLAASRGISRTLGAPMPPQSNDRVSTFH